MMTEHAWAKVERLFFQFSIKWWEGVSFVCVLVLYWPITHRKQRHIKSICCRPVLPPLLSAG